MKLSVDMLRPFLSIERTMAITSDTRAFSVMQRLPSPRRMTMSPSRLMILWTRYSPRTSRTRATHPRLSSLSSKGPRVIWSRLSTMKGFMLLPLTEMVTLMPSETMPLISSIITAFSITIFFAIVLYSKVLQN